MENIWLEVLGELVNVISGVILAGVSGLGAFYVTKLTKKMKRKEFIEDIETYVRGVEQSPLYSSMKGSQKFIKVQEFAKRKAIGYEIIISEEELDLLIESKVQLMNQDIKQLANMLNFQISGSSLSNLDDTQKIKIEAEG